MKKEGSILLETLASVIILTLTTTFIVSAYIQNSNILKNRILQEEVNRSVYNLTNEFKYNLSKKEIEELLSGDEIGFKYYSDFSKRLMEGSVKELELGNDIIVRKIGEDDIGLKLTIQADIKSGKSQVSLENEFTKSWWMDEI